METVSFRSKKIKEKVGLAIGILAAVVILFSQSFYFHYVESVEGKAHIEQASETDSNDSVIKMAHQALSGVAQITLQNALHFITHIYFEENHNIQNTYQIPLHFDSYFQTLFRLIISPNAP